jgi:hypothetical protein
MAIRNRTNRVCILAHEEALHFAATGELRTHATHQHCGRSFADQMTADLLFVARGRRIYAATWVGQGKRAIALHHLRQWRKVRSLGYGVNAVVRS